MRLYNFKGQRVLIGKTDLGSDITPLNIQRAIDNGGTYILEDNLNGHGKFFTLTVNVKTQTAQCIYHTLDGDLVETCNYALECWGYEFGVGWVERDRRWVWASSFEEAAASRLLDISQGNSCGPIIQGWK